jgi:hypothetical protein
MPLAASGQSGADFVADWLSVAADEAMHFGLLARRLRTLGSHYGALPAHDGLWDAARETAHDVAARLAVVPMVLEARGLDVTPRPSSASLPWATRRPRASSSESLTTKCAMSVSGPAISRKSVKNVVNRHHSSGRSWLRSTSGAALSRRSTTRRVVLPVCRVR